METGIRVLLLTALLALSGCASVRAWFHPHPASQSDDSNLSIDAAAQRSADDNASPPTRVIDPEVERRKIKVPKIKSRNVEIGALFGALSIEDFGTNPVYGVSIGYHVTEDFFFQAELARSTGGLTSFETLGGDIQLLTPSERRFTYYNLALGYNFLPGEVYLGRGLAMTSSFYLLAGIGSTKFAGDQRFTVNFGGGYKVLPTDWLAIRIGVEDHMFDSDLLGTTKLTNNLEASIGATVFF
jgi:outer membrane beta-barrel protein